MAITAAITLSDSSVLSEESIVATCTVSNSGGAAVQVTSIDPTAATTGATPQNTSAGLGLPYQDPGATNSVPAGGTCVYRFGVVPHAPARAAPGTTVLTRVIDIGAVVRTTDGATTNASTAALTSASAAT